MGVFAGFRGRANPERAWAFQIWEVFTERRQKMELLCVRLQIPETANLILGQSHFIKTAEDLYEVVVNTVPGAAFAVAFNEASGPRLIRVEGNDEELRAAAIANAQAIGAGHLFVLLIRQAYPINLLSRVQGCFEVCTIYCATANPVEVVVAQTEQGRGVLGVIDGSSPKGIEGPEDLRHRREFVRKIGYKL
jgi:adenosine/AMP kinase